MSLIKSIYNHFFGSTLIREFYYRGNLVRIYKCGKLVRMKYKKEEVVSNEDGGFSLFDCHQSGKNEYMKKYCQIWGEPIKWEYKEKEVNYENRRLCKN